MAAADPPAVGAITVYTDGSCERNGRPDATAGFACHVPDARERSGGWPLLDGVVPTSNRAEFAAFLKACEVADAIDPGPAHAAGGPAVRRTLLVVTDSLLLQKTVMSWLAAWRKRGWRKQDGAPVANRDLCERMAAATDGRAVVVRHVAAHTDRDDDDSVGNRVADRLARKACLEQRAVRGRAASDPLQR